MSKGRFAGYRMVAERPYESSDSEAESMDGDNGFDVPFSNQPSSSSGRSELVLSNLGLDTIPDTYITSNVSRFRTLLLNHNRLLQLPLEISRFTALVSLDLSNNQLTDIPSNLCRLDHLKVLQLTNNQLDSTSFPKDIGQLSYLEVLNVGGNRIDVFPEPILDLPMLKALYIGANRLQDLPYKIGTMLSLEILYLGGNRLKEIPATIGKLKRLSSLVLCDNRLETIPSTVADLELLESLSLHNNQLRTLPTDICKLEHLHQLSLRSNPLVVQFVRDMTFDPPSLKEMAARVIKLEHISYHFDDIVPRALISYLDSGKQCVNPKCKGVYFEARVEHVKFVDFCGKFRVPLLQYLCSPMCSTSPAYAITSDTASDSEDNEGVAVPASKMKRVLLG